MRIKIIDILIILMAAGLTVYSSYTAYIKPQNSSHVLVRAKAGEWTFPINAEETVIVQGPLGYTTVQVRENRAWVESSPCQNQTCVAAGKVWRQGQWSACLPNNVLLMIEGNNEQDEVDIMVW